MCYNQWRNWRGGAEVRAAPPGKLNVKNGPPFRDFMNCRIWKCFYKFWTSVWSSQFKYWNSALFSNPTVINWIVNWKLWQRHALLIEQYAIIIRSRLIAIHIRIHCHFKRSTWQFGGNVINQKFWYASDLFTQWSL